MTAPWEPEPWSPDDDPWMPEDESWEPPYPPPSEYHLFKRDDDDCE